MDYDDHEPSDRLELPNSLGDDLALILNSKELSENLTACLKWLTLGWIAVLLVCASVTLFL
jgi:hypothetical protein